MVIAADRPSEDWEVWTHSEEVQLNSACLSLAEQVGNILSKGFSKIIFGLMLKVEDHRVGRVNSEMPAICWTCYVPHSCEKKAQSGPPQVMYGNLHKTKRIYL